MNAPLQLVPGAGPSGLDPNMMSLAGTSGPLNVAPGGPPPMLGGPGGPAMPMGPGGPPPGAAPPSWGDQIQQRMQNPALLGLLGAGTGMLGAAGRPGGLGEAAVAGLQGGLGGFAGGMMAQKEEEKDAMMRQILEKQFNVGALGQQMGSGPAPGPQAGSPAAPPSETAPPPQVAALGNMTPPPGPPMGPPPGMPPGGPMPDMTPANPQMPSAIPQPRPMDVPPRPQNRFSATGLY